MLKLMSGVLVLLVLGFGASLRAEETRDAQVYQDLRSMVLNLKSRDIGITRGRFPHRVYGLVMETGFAEGSFTLSVIADGSTSMYFSNGGGILGGGGYEHVRKASVRLLSGAQHFYDDAQQVAVFPKPLEGDVIFYFIAFDGVRAYTASEDDLGNERDRLSSLFIAAHAVIAELRKVDANRRGE